MTIEEIIEAIYKAEWELDGNGTVRVDVADLSKLKAYILELQKELDKQKKANKILNDKLMACEVAFELVRDAENAEKEPLLNEYV